MIDEQSDGEPSKPRLCERCGERMPPQKRGRPRRWCSQQCRQSAYEERKGIPSWRDNQPKVESLSDVVEVMQERGARRSVAMRWTATPTEHDHVPPADCLETVWSNRMFAAMVVDILSLDLFKHGVQDTLEDQFVRFAISGLIETARILGLEFDSEWPGSSR
ncbi:hypothetical protein [Jatrophihabitans sp.]|uniref:hypothetical protein n=1 Tax=Jatrophihabitans sp. TaxID=1932789 RepID=UPI0030C76301|nr:hypothetical protein [Jatrophihabitans sp.]